MATEEEVGERAGHVPYLGHAIEQQRAALPFEPPTVTVPPLVNVQLAISRPDVADGEARLVDLEGMLQHQVAADLLRQVADGLTAPQRVLPVLAGGAGAGGDAGDTIGRLRQRVAVLELDLREAEEQRDAATWRATQHEAATGRVRDLLAEGLPSPSRKALLEALGGT